MQNPSPTPPPPGARRTIAVGAIRRHGGRTITVRATEAGVTGSIRREGHAPAAPAPAVTA